MSRITGWAPTYRLQAALAENVRAEVATRSPTEPGDRGQAAWSAAVPLVNAIARRALGGMR